MNRKILIFISLFFIFNLSYSQFSLYRRIETEGYGISCRYKKLHLRTFSINSSFINTQHFQTNRFFSSIELNYFVPSLNGIIYRLTRQRLFQMSLGIGTYFPKTIKENYASYLKLNINKSIWNKSHSMNPLTGIFIEYYPVYRKANIGISLQKGLIFYDFRKHSTYLNVKLDISYNYLINYAFLNLTLGVVLNKKVGTGCRKPILYFYSNDTIENLEIKLLFNGELTFTWPKYEDKWEVTVLPNSELIEKHTQERYNYLFWEGDFSNIDKDTISTGFVVENKNLAEFFKEKLSVIGLNSKEVNDFITYWVPTLSKNKYLVHFLVNDKCNVVATYNFSEEPETLLRVIALFVEYKDDDFNIKNQNLEQTIRSGFTVIEWGGAEFE